MSDASDEFDVGRFARLLALIAFVSSVFLLTGASVLSGTLFRVSAVVIGGIALVTAIVGFLVAAADMLG